jgi:hypothetical protein
VSWKRIATFAVGGALSAVGFLVPVTAPVLGPAGAALLGWATRWPEDRRPKKKPADTDDTLGPPPTPPPV